MHKKQNESRYTPAVGRKFHADGSVRYFPGNTIVCMIPSDSPISALLTEAAIRLSKLKCAGKFSLLPRSSYHMTVIQGVCDEDRKPHLWTRFLPVDAPLEQVDQLFSEQYNEIPLPSGFAMIFNYLRISDSAMMVYLLPQSEAVARSLQAFRDAVSEKLGVRFPDHERYEFHISLAYKIMHLTDEEELEIQQFKVDLEQDFRQNFGTYISSPPQLVFFKDMFAFGETR